MTEVVDHDAAVGRETRLFPFERTGCPLDPPDTYAELRENEPISRIKLRFNGREAWLVTRYEDVRTLLSDPRFCSNLAHPSYPLQYDFPMELLGVIKPTLIHMDPPDHTTHRMVLMPELTVKKVNGLRARTQEIVDECIDTILAQGPPADLVRTLAFQVPSLATADLLDIPLEHRPLFHHWIGTVIYGASAEEHGAATQAVEMVVHQLIAERDVNPGEDFISSLLERNKRDQVGLEHADISALIRVMLAGGHETTVNGTAMGALALLAHPEQAELLRANPSLGGQAVDELLRYTSVSDHGTVRVALEDVELNGTLIRAGDGVVVSLSSCNHDPEIFADPNRLDLNRKEARHNVAFGYGRHMCSGQTLARMQIEVALVTLVQRIPGIRLAVPLEEIDFKKNALIRGVSELPVTW